MEKFSFDYYSDYHDLNYYEDMITIYNIYISNYEEIIINGKLGIYILNSYQWEIKKQIIFSNHLMENVLYLNDSFFLIFLRKYIFKEKCYENKQIGKQLLTLNNENNNIAIAKIEGNDIQINFETLNNCEGKKIYYSPDINDNINKLINKFISVQNNAISIYELINIQKNIVMKNN